MPVSDLSSINLVRVSVRVFWGHRSKAYVGARGLTQIGLPVQSRMPLQERLSLGLSSYSRGGPNVEHSHLILWRLC